MSLWLQNVFAPVLNLYAIMSGLAIRRQKLSFVVKLLRRPHNWKTSNFHVLRFQLRNLQTLKKDTNLHINKWNGFARSVARAFFMVCTFTSHSRPISNVKWPAQSLSGRRDHLTTKFQCFALFNFKALIPIEFKNSENASLLWLFHEVRHS